MPVTKGAERRWSAKKFILKLEKFRALFWLGGGGEHNKDQVDQKKKKSVYFSCKVSELHFYKHYGNLSAMCESLWKL